MPKKAIVTGVTGQDGSYLVEFLLDKGYEVHGIRRASSQPTHSLARIRDLVESPQSSQRLFLHYGDITDSSNLTRLIRDISPDEIYNLAAQSHVKVSFDVPEYTANVDAIGPLRILEAIRELSIEKKVRLYQASTSELFGKALAIPQNEETPFNPRSPYAIAKQYAYWMIKNYREAYGIYAVNGILFNHESPRRGESFVTRKITLAVANIHSGNQEKLHLGNLDAKRDWGYAKEYVEAMWAMLQQDDPEDLVIGTGETHTVREFVEEAFKYTNVNIQWEGSGKEEKGVDAATGRVLVEIDPYYFRPTEVELLIGDGTKAKEKLGWEPKVGFKELVKIMMEAELKGIG